MDEAGINARIAALLRRDRRAANAARQELAALGDEAVPHLSALLAGTDGGACVHSAELLAMIGTEAAVEALAQAAYPPQETAPTRTARLALRRVAHRNPVALFRLLTTKDAGRISAALDALDVAYRPYGYIEVLLAEKELAGPEKCEAALVVGTSFCGWPSSRRRDALADLRHLCRRLLKHKRAEVRSGAEAVLDYLALLLTLLRPAEPDSGHLLRPAETSNTSPDLLLRPSDDLS